LSPLAAGVPAGEQRTEVPIRLPDPGSRFISLSLDADNQWSYMKTHGDAGWEELPSYLDDLVEVTLPRFRRHGLTLTVFLVGQDAALDKNREALRAVAEAGHEIGNHSFHHEPWLHLYSRPEMEREIGSAHEHIEKATGRRPVGFRGPGFTFSDDLLRVLAAHGYRYDGSTYPTFLGPLMRAYYFWKSSGFSEEEKKKRAALFGSVRDGLRPLNPYMWEVDGKELVEIPVTTMPLFRTPIHMSYLLYLATFSRGLMEAYLATALKLLYWSGVNPSFLLHPLDFLGGDRVKALAFFPGMGLATEYKLEVFDHIVAAMRKAGFQPVTMRQHAEAAAASRVPRRRVGA
jgi:peptidoglycan/xylan/chitin deacetylase (PgdA/CDA1 family)